MQIKLQIVLTDQWSQIFETVERRYAVLGIAISRAEIAKQMMDLGLDAYLERLKAQESVLPKRPPRVWTAQGVVPTLSDAEPPPKAPKPPRAKNK
jgi:hypothetical protein